MKHICKILAIAISAAFPLLAKPQDQPLLEKASMIKSADANVANFSLKFTSMEPPMVMKAWINQRRITSARLEFDGARIPVALGRSFTDVNSTHIGFSLPISHVKDAKLVITYRDTVPADGKSHSFTKTIELSQVPQ